MVTLGKACIFKQKVYVVDFIAHEPTTIKDVLLHDHWRKAIDEEYVTLLKNMLA